MASPARPSVYDDPTPLTIIHHQESTSSAHPNNGPSPHQTTTLTNDLSPTSPLINPTEPTPPISNTLVDPRTQPSLPSAPPRRSSRATKPSTLLRDFHIEATLPSRSTAHSSSSHSIKSAYCSGPLLAPLWGRAKPNEEKILSNYEMDRLKRLASNAARMDSRLMNAAQSGNVEELKSILEEDPLVLQRVSLAPTGNTPLHVATLAGRTEFVREMVRLEPSFAWEVNEEGLSPLHIASATGHGDLVRELLAVSPDLCFIKDNGGRTPLHYAAMKGRVRIIPELHAKCPQAAKEVTAKGETLLHLAVANNHYNVVKVLLEEMGDDAKELLDATDNNGQSVMHVASLKGQSHTMRLLSVKLQAAEEEGCRNDEEVVVMEAVSQRTNRTEKLEEPAEAIFKSMSRRLDEIAPIVASLISSDLQRRAIPSQDPMEGEHEA
ncbi:hypothetical protein V2J09_016624 [Rumex salicifolius]